ncbi:MAG: acetyltransferase [Calditrichaeota bacterium]|nr:MAG: transferase [Calditrichota bacterium]MBL1204051.1 acetyltransferase [Calditrichota bacterium]NOG43882.1 acetyltransferase [Calditrichota bacterium]
MSKVVIFGQGMIADEAYFYLTNDSEHEIVAFTVDAKYKTKDEQYGLPVVPFEEIKDKFPPNEYKMFVAVGYQKLNQLRAEKYNQAKENGYQLISYVSSRAANMGNVPIGDNCFILENCSIQPCSKIGNNVTIWSNNILGHHSEIKDHCYIAGHVSIAGHSEIGAFTFIGVNAMVGHEVNIGESCLIGGGARVTKSAEAGSVFIMPDTEKFRLDSKTFIKMTRL